MKVKLHPNEKEAADATDRTIQAVAHGVGALAHLVRGADGEVEFDEHGRAELLSTDPGYLAFAVKNQGYVADVVNS